MQGGKDQQSKSANGSDSRNSSGDEGLTNFAAPIAELGQINPTSLEPAHPDYRQLPTSPLSQTTGKPNAKDNKPLSIGLHLNSLVKSVNDRATIRIKPMESGSVSIKPSVKYNKPLGFGLHLNSLLNSANTGSAIRIKTMESGSVSIRAMPSSTFRLHSSESSRTCPLSSMDGNQLLETIYNDEIEKDQPFAATSEAELFPNSTKQAEFESSKPLEPISFDERMYSTANSNINEEPSQSSPKKKRIKRLDLGDGPKRCNCKRNSCLKLYCDCFAAGIYCTEPCACQGCFNRPVYKDRVNKTGLQIEPQNPPAFAPKILQHATGASTERCMENRFLSSSSRHKRGCGCKKSMCLKNICHCYRDNVGCSDGCRCDGCQNVYGRKEEYVNDRHLSEQEIRELYDVFFGGKPLEVASTEDTLCTPQLSPHEMTPQTPTFQYSNHGKDGSKPWFPSASYLNSPESAKAADSYLISPGSSGNIYGVDKDINKDSFDPFSFYQELDEFSPRYHGPGSMSDIHSSFDRNLSFGAMDSDSGLCEALEDDTPDILKDNISPLNSGKVRSPDKKRVSPPHVTLRPEFVLKSVPSFSPQTPSIDSKDENPEPRQTPSIDSKDENPEQRQTPSIDSKDENPEPRHDTPKV